MPFLRDEGHRYDPELALTCYQLALGLSAGSSARATCASPETPADPVEARH